MTVQHHLTNKLFFSQWLILGVAFLTLGSVTCFNLYLERGRTQSREQARLLTQARVIQENIGQNLMATKDVLKGLRKSLPKGQSNPDLNDRLKVLSDAIPGVRTLFILDATGTIRAASRSELLGKNFSQRDYFKVPQQHRNADTLYVSPPFRTVLGNFLINVGIMIPGPRGEFAGVVTAALDPQYFAPLLDSVRYAPDMRVGIVHGDGDVFMFVSELAHVADKNLAQPGSSFSLYRTSGQAASVSTDIAYFSGGKRMIAFRTYQMSNLNLDKPLVVIADRDLNEIYAGWRHDALAQGVLYGLITLASILWLYLNQRQQRETSRQAVEVAEVLRATHALIKESEEKYKAIIETTDTGYVILDARGRVSDANSEYVRLSGHTRLEEIVGRSPMEWTVEHDRERNATEVEKCLKTGSVRNLEIDYVDGSGQITPVEINATAIQSGTSYQILSLCRDVSERKQSERHRITQAEEQRRALVREVNHHIKNNIQAISGILARHAKTLGRANLAERAIFHKAIDQLETIATVHGLHASHLSNRCGVIEILDSICLLAEYRLREETPSVFINKHWLLGEKVLLAESESIPIALVVNELLTNAVKHCRREAGRIMLQVSGDKNGLSIRVKNQYDSSTAVGKGAGRSLIEALCAKEGASIEWIADGTIMIAEVRLRPPIIE